MSLHQPPNDVPRDLAWRVEKLLPGEQLFGYVAGPVVGVWTHWTGSSKPCRYRTTRGVLACPLCDGLGVIWRGYVPVLGVRPASRAVVILSKTSYEDCRKDLRVKTAVRIWRPAGVNKAVKVERFLQETVPLIETTNIRLQPVADINRYLLRKLWKDEILAAWYEAQQARYKPEPEQPTTDYSPERSRLIGSLASIFDANPEEN
jgi:hypothetical protein